MTESPDRPLVIPALTPAADELVEWLSFLAGRTLDEDDRVTLTTAVAEEGPLAELATIEARRTLRVLDRLDPVARAHAWVQQRTRIHQAEQQYRTTKRALLVLHRHDPVLLPVQDGHPVVTERSVADWAALRTVVTGIATHEDQLADVETFDPDHLRSTLLTPIPADLGVLDLRRRVGHAPMARAAVAELLWDPADLRRIQRSLAGLDPGDTDLIDAQIVRLWTVAELRRLDRVVRPAAINEDSANSCEPTGTSDT
ncbi:MAG: hypothetical protein AAF962_17015 [Actinomycetota bacterium]